MTDRTPSRPRFAIGDVRGLRRRALTALLAEHLARRGLTAADADAWIFPGPKGGPLRYANFHDRVWVPACTRAGLEGLGFHDLRRAAATVLVTSGVDVRTAQHRLGHSDPRLTLAVYAQVAPHADRAAAAAIEDPSSPARAMNARWKVTVRW
jgi:integrase